MVEVTGINYQEAGVLRASASEQAPRPNTVETGSVTTQTSGGAGQGSYFSPVLRIDSETQKIVILFRDENTGEVKRQYPSERQLEAYRGALRQQSEPVVAPGEKANGNAVAADGAAGQKVSGPTAPEAERPKGQSDQPALHGGAKVQA